MVSSFSIVHRITITRCELSADQWELYTATDESGDCDKAAQALNRAVEIAARSFDSKNQFVSQRGGVSAMTLASFPTDKEKAYQLHLWFHLTPERMFTKGYGKAKNVKHKFRQIDTSNLIKLAEDSIAELLGLGDRQNFTVCAHKRVTDGEEYMLALLMPLDLEEDPYAFEP